MAPFGIFKRKKKVKEAEETAEKRLLDELCKGDVELRDVLSRTLLINPRMSEEAGGIDSHAKRAQEHEKKQEPVRARIEYQLAGELALYEGKLAQIQKYFKKATEVDPNYPQKNVFEFFVKKENAEKALAVAQEYYARTAKPVPTKPTEQK